MTWRFLDTAEGDPAFNMAVDEVLLEGVLAGRSPPTFRTYRWRPPAFSIGYFQDLEKQIDTGRCREQEIQWIRRPTGGRTVLHGWDLTYSVAAAVGDLASGADSISDAYRVISMGLVEGLRLLGIDAEFTRPHVVDPAARTVKPCFTSISRFEVSAGGRKIVGSAQRVVAGSLLQHGSVPLVSPPRGPEYFVPGVGDHERSSLAGELAVRSVVLSELLESPVSYEEARDALRAGFAGVLGQELEPGSMSAEEELSVKLLSAGKYRSDDWNRGTHDRADRS